MGNIKTVECPSCHSELWIDMDSGEIVQHKKPEKKNFSSFESLLQKEKEKKEKADQRFEQAKQLKDAKRKKAEDFFKNTFKD